MKMILKDLTSDQAKRIAVKDADKLVGFRVIHEMIKTTIYAHNSIKGLGKSSEYKIVFGDIVFTKITAKNEWVSEYLNSAIIFDNLKQFFNRHEVKVEEA